MKKLKELTKVTAGQAAPKEFSDKGLPFIRAGNLEQLLGGLSLNDLPKVDSEVAKKNGLKKIPINTIVFAKSGMSATKNRVYITNSESYFVSHLAGILPNDSYISAYLSRYLSWCNPANLILDNAYPSIRLEDINNLEIPLPPLPEQKRIADLLDAANSLRQKDKALLKKYDQLAQSLFLDMFGDPVKNEKGWEVFNFSAVAKNENSKRVAVKQSDRDKREGIYPYYGATGIIDSIDDFKYDGTFLLIAEDGKNLLYRRKNNAFHAYGKFWVNNHAHVLSFNGISNLKYLEFFLNSIDFDPYISGIDQIKLNKESLNKIPTPIPPIELQNQFAEKVKLIEKQKELAKKNLEKSEALFGALMGEVFGSNN